jgi:hypothetical protein
MTPAERKAATARAFLRMAADGADRAAEAGDHRRVLQHRRAVRPHRPVVRHSLLFGPEWVVIPCRYVLPFLLVAGWALGKWRMWQMCKQAEGLDEPER